MLTDSGCESVAKYSAGLPTWECRVLTEGDREARRNWCGEGLFNARSSFQSVFKGFDLTVY